MTNKFNIKDGCDDFFSPPLSMHDTNEENISHIFFLQLNNCVAMVAAITLPLDTSVCLYGTLSSTSVVHSLQLKPIVLTFAMDNIISFSSEHASIFATLAIDAVLI